MLISEKRPGKNNAVKLRAVLLFFMLMSLSTPVMSEDISAVSASNPNGRWSYGWSAGYGAAFNIYNVYNTGDAGTWYSSSISNQWNIPQIHSYNNYLALHPGTNYEESILRYKVNHTDRYRINVTFNGVNGCGGGATTNTRVYINGSNVFNGIINGNTSNYVTDVSLSENDVIYFAVGPGPLRVPFPPDFTCDTTFVYGSVIDLTTPDTSIISSPDNITKVTDATFIFASSESNSTFQCSIDDAVYAPCTNPVSYTNLTDAVHSLKVKASDAEGNIDPTPATFSWTINTTVPETTITKNPADPTNSTSADFEFSASEASTFECSLDGAAYAACSSPQSYTGLAAGSHSFSVKATDTAGNTDATPASYSWVVDTTAPNTTITAQPANPTTETTASFSFVSTEAGSTFLCTLDGVAVACVSPKEYTGLVVGTHTFSVVATDTAGNTDPTPATYVWTIDAPDTTPPSGSVSINNGAASTNTTTVTLTLSATDNSGSVTQMQFSNNGSSWSGWQAYATSKAWSLFTGTGSKTVYAQFKDAAGNIATVNDTISYEAASTTTVNTGSNVIIAPVAEVELAFTSVTTEGSVTVTQETTPSPPANFRVVTGTSYDIAPPTGTYTLPVTISIDYSDAALADSSNESRIRLFHYNSSTGSWEDITTSVDTANNRVYGLATSFSPFILGEPTTTVTTAKVPVMNGWWLLPAGVMGIGVMRRRRK